MIDVHICQHVGDFSLLTIIGPSGSVSCCICGGRDGFFRLISMGSEIQPLFSHLGCSFLTPGGSITDFVTMTIAAPALECRYSGLFLVNPGTEYVNDNRKDDR